MKKIFTVLLSAILLFAGCAKIEDMSVRDDNFGRTKIIFNTGTSTTKSIIDSTVMEDNFGVYGYISGSSAYLLDNAEYDKNGNAANGKTYYWPVSDNALEVLFTAYSQFDDGVSLNTAEDSVIITVPTLTQDLINNDENFNDILWAQTKTTHYSNSGRVNLTFRHALSWLQFRAEVDSTIKYVNVKSVKFGEYTDGQDAIDPIPETPAYDDTTDTWVNLKRSYSAVGSATKLKGPGESGYTNAAALPADLVSEIKSYYSIDGGAPGDYDLHMGNSVWPSSTIKKLRVVKVIPDDYKIVVEMTGGEKMTFFNGWKYLSDNDYDIQPANTGGKPDVWNYILIDAFVNGGAYTVVGLNPWDSNATPQHTIEHHDAVPGTPGQPAIPAGFLSEGLYVNGTLTLPTKDTLKSAPSVVITGQKDTTLNHCSKTWTINGRGKEILGNALVVPQSVPTNITVVFDVCVVNNNGQEILITDRSVTRTINTGDDMLNVEYANKWLASNKYIYNFKFKADSINFDVNVIKWTSENNNYHVWDY